MSETPTPGEARTVDAARAAVEAGETSVPELEAAEAVADAESTQAAIREHEASATGEMAGASTAGEANVTELEAAEAVAEAVAMEAAIREHEANASGEAHEAPAAVEAGEASVQAIEADAGAASVDGEASRPRAKVEAGGLAESNAPEVEATEAAEDVSVEAALLERDALASARLVPGGRRENLGTCSKDPVRKVRCFRTCRKRQPLRWSRRARWATSTTTCWARARTCGCGSAWARGWSRAARGPTSRCGPRTRARSA
ncbi:hypothetical protein OV079_07860 [Nannocystis pusilla]|uniref:Uncharacterized protein n=1 Tax=Nannocystis pusilla TaxID=889268 RepID=A0A9X3IX66_9BACT|nr:hypothetical protein [Nannocystis pusilla]MCY1005488.1 hypothetical protein [Nannocystis pusilla]